MTSEQRNAEIWSTRLQRELLALTSQADDTHDLSTVLPPFLTLQDHSLDIEHGVATVSFLLTVPQTAEAEDIVIVLDASMPHKGKHHESVDLSKSAYPFVKPHVLLKSGASQFPPGSTVQNGDELRLDCDWTPSLHLTDAVLNVGLLIKESILQGEPYHKKPMSEMMAEDPVEEMKKNARKFGSFLTKSARSWVPTAGASLSSETAETHQAAAAASQKSPKKRTPSATDIQIGDEISLLESPWADCRGVYSCKAIRRPGFIEDAMAIANQEVAGTGLAGAGAMFRSFTKSAKSVLEESFLMITDTHIIELRSSKLNLSTGIVTFVISIEMMAKLKFRRQESISLFFKPAPDDPLIYMCPDSADAVRQIQTVMQSKHGVKGKHTNAATQRAIHEALQIVQEIQAKERALEYQPSTERVNEIMDLYRQAAERFEAAGDARHAEVVEHMKKFLALPLVASILDGSYVPAKPEAQAVTPEPSTTPSSSSVPEGEVIARTPEQLAGDDHDTEEPEKAKEEDKQLEEKMDSILQEVGSLNVDDDEHLDTEESGGADGGDDALADLDAMLRDVDNELADIMNT